MQNPIRIQASFVVPSPSEILSPGQVVIDRTQILEVCSGSQEKADLDLGDAVLLPGLVNAHTHLEFSDLSEPIPAGRNFPSWIGNVIRHRNQQLQGVNEADKVARRSAALTKGLIEASRSGTVLLADIMSYPGQIDDYPSLARSAQGYARSDGIDHQAVTIGSADVIGLPEVIGLSADRWSLTSRWASDLMDASEVAGSITGLSPHSPYSLPIDQLLRFYDSIPEPPLTAMHLAESRDELEWLQQGTGAFRESFQAIGLPILDVRPSIEEVLDFLAARKRALIVHGNYLTDSQIEFLSGRSHLTVVYCPRTHRHFGHEPYPFRQLNKSGVRMVLATDSRASNPNLDLWGEVVQARESHPDLSPSQAIASVTTNAAEALGVQKRYGRLAAGMFPWVNIVRPKSTTRATLLEDLTNQNQELLPLCFTDHLRSVE